MFDTTPSIDCAGRKILLDRPRVMAVINVTPDSFSDGGRHQQADRAVAHALAMVEQGADVLDVGGESTRPGAAAVALDEELQRVIPVIERLVRETGIPVSVDTSKPEVMRAAVGAGAGLINDVHALRIEGALDAAAALGVPVCLMHMKGDPGNMQDDPAYEDVVAEVHGFFTQRLFACEMAGISRKNLLVDPGFGFGKNLEHNLRLLRQLARFRELGVPLLAGLSRKGMIGQITGRPVDERLAGSVAAALVAVQNGAQIVRVHDVAATVDALAVWAAVSAQASPVLKTSQPTMPRWGDDD